MGVIRTVLAVDGEEKFKATMKEVNSTLKAMQANVKSLSSEYTTNKTKADNLRKQNEQLKEIESQLQQKMKALTDQVSRSKDAYDAAQKKLADVIKAHGEESDEARKAQNAVAAAAVTYNNYRTQLSQTEVALNETQQAVRENNKELNELGKRDFSKLKSAIKEVANAAATAAKGEFAAFKASVQAVTGEFEIALKGLTAYTAGVTGAAAAVGKFSVDAGATFEQSLSELQAISQADTDTMKEFSKAAQQMGRTTSKTASESAQALKYMALAGWDTEEMLVGLQPMIKASEAGGMDLATASDLITDSLAAYGKSAQDMEQYLDILTAAQSSSNSSLQQMLEAYVEVGGTFKNLNVPMEESAGVLGILADRGIKGSEAGNKLSSALVNLVGANKNAAGAMADLGVSAWDENGEFIGLSNTVSLLGDKLSQLTDEEMVKFEAKIGGKMQIDTLQALIAGTSDEYGELIERLENSKGALNETAETMLNNFNGAVTLMKSALEGLGISIFETFKSPLTDSVKQLTEWVGDMAYVIEQGGSVVGITKKISAEFRESLRKGINDARKVIPDITEIFNQFILEGAYTIIRTLPSVTQNILNNLVSGMFDLLNGLTDYMPEFTIQLTYSINRLFDTLIPAMSQFIEHFTETLPDIITNFRNFMGGEKLAEMYLAGMDILMTLASGIADNLDVILEEAGIMLRTMIEGIMERLPEIIETAMSIVMSLVNTITENLPWILDTGVQMILALIEGLVNDDNLVKIISAAVDIVLAVVDAIINNLDQILQVAIKILIALIEGITQNLDKITDEIPKIIDAIVKALVNPDTIALLLKAAVEIVEALGLALVDSADLILKSMDGIAKSIITAFTDVDWSGLGSNIIKGICEGFGKVGNLVTEKVKSVASDIFNGFTDFFDINSPSRLMRDKVGFNIGAGITEGIEPGLEDGTQDIKSATGSFSNNILDSLNGLYDGFSSAYSAITSDYTRAGNTGAGISGDLNININAEINSDADIDELGYRVAAIVRQNAFAGGA